jgi:alpha-L-fucosidase
MGTRRGKTARVLAGGDRDDWFRGAGLGLFVHWDHASQQGLEVSWPLVGGIPVLPSSRPVSVAQYHSSIATFDPVHWDPVALADLADRSGARYAVLTAKHHSGYAMWPSTVGPDRSIAASPYRGDLVGEFVGAMRAAGLRVGLYLSLPDWGHPDYPAFTDDDRPYVLGSSPPFPGTERWERFLADLEAQVDELLTGYGTIDLLWFDGGWERTAVEWRPAEFEARIRAHQPGIVLNDRFPGMPGYATPEQFVPATTPSGPWETCLTMNHAWGWVPEDTDYKSARRLVHTLAEVTARGGNLLLNVSPTGDGSLPEPQVERLEAMATWMARHAEAVHDVGPGLEPWQFHGPSTRRGDTVYCICLARPYDEVVVRGVPVRRVRSARALGTGRSLEIATETGVLESFMPDPEGTLRIQVADQDLDELATVVALDIAPG